MAIIEEVIRMTAIKSQKNNHNLMKDHFNFSAWRNANSQTRWSWRPILFFETFCSLLEESGFMFYGPIVMEKIFPIKLSFPIWDIIPNRQF